MAQILKQFPGTSPSRGRSIYPWDQWLDGQVWKLTSGADFQTTVAIFRKCADHASMRRGGRVRTASVDNAVVLQFIRVDAMPVFSSPRGPHRARDCGCLSPCQCGGAEVQS